MEEKPFAPSKKKLKKSRSEGDVPFSKLLESSLFFLGSLLLLRALAPQFCRSFIDCFHFTFSFWGIMLPLLLFWLGSMALAVFANVIQTGLLFSLKGLKPKFFKKIAFDKSFLLVPVVLTLLGGLFFYFGRVEGKLVQMNSKEQIDYLLGKCFTVALLCALALVILGVIDFFNQKRLFMNKMRMTSQEKKDEARENEVKKRG